MTLVAQSPLSLNHYLREIPRDNAQKFTYKAFAYNVLEKICWVALAAIMASIVMASYGGGIALLGNTHMAMAGMAFSTILFSLALPKFKIRADYFKGLANIERRVAEEAESIAAWSTERIEQFCRDEELDLTQIPRDTLSQLNANEPLKALLPLIARFNYFKRSAQEILDIPRQQLIRGIEEGFEKRERETGEPVPPEVKRWNRNALRRAYYHEYEHNGIPRAFEAAVLLQLIQQPTRELEIQQLGEYRIMEFEERQFSRIYPPIDPTYFHFHPALNRPPLALAEVEHHLQPKDLRRLLFNA